jgi:hypothetical protein
MFIPILQTPLENPPIPEVPKVVTQLPSHRHLPIHQRLIINTLVYIEFTFHYFSLIQTSCINVIKSKYQSKTVTWDTNFIHF